MDCTLSIRRYKYNIENYVSITYVIVILIQYVSRSLIEYVTGFGSLLTMNIILCTIIKRYILK